MHECENNTHEHGSFYPDPEQLYRMSSNTNAGIIYMERELSTPPPPSPRPPRYFRNPPGRYVRALWGVLLCLVEAKEVQRRVDPGDEAGYPTLDASLPRRASQVRTWTDLHNAVPGSTTDFGTKTKKLSEPGWNLFLRARVWWPLRCLCRLFCIFERCLDFESTELQWQAGALPT